MKFKNTKLFSPVIYGGDVPHELDLYWHDPDNIPDTEKQFAEFIKDNKIIIDTDYWEVQKNRCVYGYTVEDVIESGGDYFVDDKIALRDPDHWLVKQKTKNFKKGDYYIPHLDYHVQGNKFWIPPKMYFYLNFWNIKRLDKEKLRKTVGNPYFTDLSWDNWMIRRRMFKEQKDNIFAKSRQRGLSEEEACNLAWFFLLLEDVQLAIVSGEDKYTQNTFNFVKRGINRLKRTQFYKQIGVKNDEVIRTLYTGAELYARTALTNTQVLSSLSPFFTLLEEIGIWKKGFVKEVAEFLRPSLAATGTKTGWLSYIGTGGDVEDGVDDMEYILYNPEEAEVLDFDNIEEDGDAKIGGFIPAWKFEIIDDDGNSLKEESIKKLNKERESKDATKRFLAITTKPLKPSEIFGVKGGTYFGESVKQRCIEQKMRINNHKELKIANRYRIEWKDKKDLWKGVVPILDSEGEFVIVELPTADRYGNVPEQLYGVGTDSYDQDESETSKSKGACVVKKGRYLEGGLDKVGIYNNYVAYVLQRPTADEGGKEMFYENSAKLTMLYNAKNTIEHSKILIMEWYKRKGLSNLMMLKPGITIANIVDDSKATNKYGFPGALVDEGLSILKDKLNKDDAIENCYLVEILTAWSRFKRQKHFNCDITIASMLADITLHEWDAIDEYVDNNTIEGNDEKFGYKLINGSLVNTFA